MLAGADRFASSSAVLASGQTGVVTIGSTATVLEQGLLDAIAALAEELPDLRIIVEELSSAESLTAGYREGRVDFACGNAPADGPDMTSTRPPPQPSRSSCRHSPPMRCDRSAAALAPWHPRGSSPPAPICPSRSSAAAHLPDSTTP